MTQSSNQDIITLSTLGMSHKQFAELSDLYYQYDPKILCKVFDMDKEELGEVYRQAGILRPYVEPKSVEGFNYIMLWMYLSGRIRYGLNCYGKVDYLTDPRKRADRAMVDHELFTVRQVTERLKEILNFPNNQSWIYKYMATSLVSASNDGRRAILTDITVNGRYDIMRSDYSGLSKYLDVNKIRHRRNRICYSNLQIFSLLDRIRIEACHVYKGNREDFAFTLKGSATRRKLVESKTDLYIPDLSCKGKCGSAIIKSLRLG